MSYLSVEECKIVCLASRVLHGMVISSSSFSKRIVLRLITNNQLNTNNKMKNLRLSSWLWPSVEFDTTLSSQILQFLQNNAAVLTNITTLRLHQCCTESVQEQDRTRALLNMILGNCYRLVDIQVFVWNVLYRFNPLCCKINLDWIGLTNYPQFDPNPPTGTC